MKGVPRGEYDTLDGHGRTRRQTPFDMESLNAHFIATYKKFRPLQHAQGSGHLVTTTLFIRP